MRGGVLGLGGALGSSGSSVRRWNLNDVASGSGALEPLVKVLGKILEPNLQGGSRDTRA